MQAESGFSEEALMVADTAIRTFVLGEIPDCMFVASLAALVTPIVCPRTSEPFRASALPVGLNEPERRRRLRAGRVLGIQLRNGDNPSTYAPQKRIEADGK